LRQDADPGQRLDQLFDSGLAGKALLRRNT